MDHRHLATFQGKFCDERQPCSLRSLVRYPQSRNCSIKVISTQIHQHHKTTMMSLTSILAMVTLVATTVDNVEAHGYMKDPPVSFIGKKENSEWVTEIPPLWKGDWQSCKNDKEMLAMFEKLAPANNFKDLRTLMDGNPAFGPKCGHTDINAKPVPPPSKGQAILSRGIVHAGPCAICLNDTVVYSKKDCQSSTGDGTKGTPAVFKPVDYSSCAQSGCVFRFYWLALQRLEGEVKWQSYMNCVRIAGSSGGGGGDDVSQAELSGNSNDSQNNTIKDNEPKKSDKSEDSKKESDKSKDSKKDSDKSKDSKKDSDKSKDSKKDSDKSKDSKKDSDKSKDSKESKKDSGTPPAGGDSTQTPLAGGDSTQTPPPNTPESPSPSSPGTPAMTPAPSSKCKGRRRRRY